MLDQPNPNNQALADRESSRLSENQPTPSPVETARGFGRQVAIGLILLLTLALCISLGFVRGMFNESTTLLLTGFAAVLLIALVLFSNLRPRQHPKGRDRH